MFNDHKYRKKLPNIIKYFNYFYSEIRYKSILLFLITKVKNNIEFNDSRFPMTKECLEIKLDHLKNFLSNDNLNDTYSEYYTFKTKEIIHQTISGNKDGLSQSDKIVLAYATKDKQWNIFYAPNINFKIDNINNRFKETSNFDKGQFTIKINLDKT